MKKNRTNWIHKIPIPETPIEWVLYILFGVGFIFVSSVIIGYTFFKILMP